MVVPWSYFEKFGVADVVPCERDAQWGPCLSVKGPGGSNCWTFKQNVPIGFGVVTIGVGTFYAGWVTKLCPRESGVGR